MGVFRIGDLERICLLRFLSNGLGLSTGRRHRECNGEQQGKQENESLTAEVA